MKRRQTQKPREPGTLKKAINDLITACGGFEAAHELCRVSVGQLFNYTDPSEKNKDVYMPIDVVRALELACGKPIITSYVLAREGYRLASVAEPANGDPRKLLVRVVRAAGQFCGDAVAALGNGGLTKAESGKLLSQAMEMSAEFGILARTLGRIVETKAEAKTEGGDASPSQ